MTLKQDCNIAALLWTCAHNRYLGAQVLVEKLYARGCDSGKLPDEATCRKAEQALAWAEEWLMDASDSYREAMARYEWLHSPAFSMRLQQLGAQEHNHLLVMRERLVDYENGLSLEKPEGCYTIEALAFAGDPLNVAFADRGLHHSLPKVR